MIGRRTPTLAERRRDARSLSAFLEPEVATAIAAMPVVDFSEPRARFADRADAWLWRTERLLRRMERAA